MAAPHIRANIAVITDVTAGEGVLAVMGPNARAVAAGGVARRFLECGEPLSAPRRRSRSAWASRVRTASPMWASWAGRSMSAPTWPRMCLKRCARRVRIIGLKLCGMHVMDSCRIEKGFRHFGHDITCEDHVLEAGLGFAVQNANPISSAATPCCASKDEGLGARMLQFRLTDPEPLLYHNEPILRDGQIVGYLSLWQLRPSPGRRRSEWAMCPARAKP